MCRRTMSLSYFTLVLVTLQLSIAYGFNTETDPGLVGLWKLDDGSGTIAIDSSPSGNNGTFVGAPLWVEGYHGSGLLLDGSDDAVEIANPLDLNSNHVTITAWVKRNGEQSSWAAFVFTRSGGSVAGFGFSETIELRYHWNNDTWSFSSGLEPPDNEWFFAALVIEPTRGTLYLNEQTAVNEIDHDIEEFGGALYIGQDPQGGRFMYGTIDEVSIYNRSLTQEEVKMVMMGVSPTLASVPIPDNEETEVIRDVVLSWVPGIFADRHDVYLGTTLEDVNSADTSSPLLVSPAQDANSFNAGRLEFGQEYFWRIDEINAPPDETVFKGDIWSFTVEHLAYSIPSEKITVSATSQMDENGPENTANRSGLDANDLHSKNTDDMWVSGEAEPGSVVIQYDFDKPYKLHQMLVWNYNGAQILYMYGFKEVTIEYSLDEVDWKQIEDVTEFDRAPGTNGYAPNTIVDFNDVAVKYVRITANSNWSMGFLTQYGLSEVQFKYIPVNAQKSSPENEATEIAIDVTLGWRVGREAVEHNLYLDTDQQAVTDATIDAVNLLQAEYGPLSLDLSKTYYWRVDEVNDTEIWQSDIWSFTTEDYLVVDDFESYNDINIGQEDSNRIYLTWTDGYENPNINGSTTGYPDPDFASGEHFTEPNTVHGGSQSAPLFYDNSVAGYSEVTVNPADLTVGPNWTKGSAATLVLWFYGDPNNDATEQMYVKVNGTKVLYDGDAANITRQRWTQWNVDISSLGVNPGNVATFSIGFERTTSPGGSGMIFVDDIRLYRSAPPVPVATEPEDIGLVAYYTMENNVQDVSGNGLDGTLSGGPSFSAGIDGSALSLDGVDDYVDCGSSASFDVTEEVTLSAWVNTIDAGNDEHNPFVGKGDNAYAIKHSDGNSLEFFIYGEEEWHTAYLPVDDSFNGQWHHVAGTYDGSQVKLYINGGLAGSVDYEGPIDINTYPVNIGRNSEATSRLYNGAIDEVRIYNRALSAGEILYIADQYD